LRLCGLRLAPGEERHYFGSNPLHVTYENQLYHTMFSDLGGHFYLCPVYKTCPEK